MNGVGDCKWCVSKSGTYTNPKGDNEKAKASTPVDYSKLPKAHPDHLEPHEQAFYNRWKDKLGLERIPNTKDGKVKK